MNALSASGLADLAGVTEAEVRRLVDLGILVARDGAAPFRETDAQKVRLATACEQAGLPMEGIAAAIRDGRLSFAFLEATPYRQWAVRSARTYRQVSQQTAMEQAAQRAADLNYSPLIDRALMAAYRRQQELAWIEQLVEEIEAALEQTGVLGRPGRVPAMCFLDLVGYTRLTEDQGDQVAAELAETLSVLVDRSSRERGGVPVKWLGDGVMVHFRDPAGAVLAALQMVEELPEAGLPPAHVGVAAGPVVVQGGDYFGRTVNLAARIAAYASASRVLVSDRVVERAPPRGVTFVELGQVRLEGIAHPMRLLEARRA